MRTIYFDNSATTKTDARVIELMAKVMGEDYGNPSSKHMMGFEAEKYIKEAKENFAGILKAKEKEIFFTSGGTESNNLAIFGAAQANKRRGTHVITTAIEHDSVSKCFEELRSRGFEVTLLGTDSSGHIDTNELKEAVREDTVLVSVMYVNNETGAVNDIAAAARAVKEKNPGALFHSDCVQAFGKYEIYPEKAGIDLLSASSHKLHGPKGAGLLYIRDGAKIKPQILGGGQQRGMRSGTDNVPGIAGFSLAAELAYEHLKDNVSYITDLKDYMTDALESLNEKSKGAFAVTLNSEKGSLSAPHIVNASFVPVKSEVLLHALEEKGIYVSAGSACASNRNEKSNTLKALGLSDLQRDCALRFSFSKYNTKEEIKETIKALEELLPVLSRFVPK